MSDYSDTKVIIENMAGAKLVMNSHKGNIEDLSEEQIIRLLKCEVGELEEASDLMHIIEEAADVYNFLMAIVHKKVLEYRGRKQC